MATQSKKKISSSVDGIPISTSLFVRIGKTTVLGEGAVTISSLYDKEKAKLLTGAGATRLPCQNTFVAEAKLALESARFINDEDLVDYALQEISADRFALTFVDSNERELPIAKGRLATACAMALSKDNFFSVFLTVRNPSPKKVISLPGAMMPPAVVPPSAIDTTNDSHPPVTPLLFSPQRKPLRPPDNYKIHARFSAPFDMSAANLNPQPGTNPGMFTDTAATPRTVPSPHEG